MRFKHISFILLPLFFLLSCQSEEATIENPTAKGGKRYGGTFKFMSVEKIRSLYPIFSGDVYTMRVISQLFDPLLTIDPKTGKACPAIAESFKVNDDATVYTFKIRKGVKFHEDPCFKGKTKEVTAHDVKFSLEIACSALNKNKVYFLLGSRIEGVDSFHEKSKNTIPKSGVSGIQVLDDYTIQIRLKNSFSGFEKVLTHTSLGITSREAYKMYGKAIGKHPVGTGPFSLKSFDKDAIVLKRNPYYWRKDDLGNQLPFLSEVVMKYAKNKRSALLAFGKADIDIALELPIEEIDHILGSFKDAQNGKNIVHKVVSEKSMSTMYVALANQSDEFKDRRVRRAFNMAINREEIIDIDLQGEGWAVANGFLPEMEGYPKGDVIGHQHNLEEARELMAQAGYPDGENFPTVDFYVNSIKGSTGHKTCMAIARQIKKNLNVNLNIVLCTIEERERAIVSGKAKIWRSGWIADYPSPENFLTLFYSKHLNDNASTVNAFKFKNTEYDSIFERALLENDSDQRMSLFAQCDQLIIDEGAVIPVLTNDHIVMINARVRDFQVSSMESLNLTNVYIKENK